MPKSLYFNIEDDIKSIVERIQRENGDRFILVFPRKSYLFADAVNLKLLKKQLEVIQKQASILTMDDKGQAFASQAGFDLVEIPKGRTHSGFSDVKLPSRPKAQVVHQPKTDVVSATEKADTGQVEEKLEPKITPKQTKSAIKVHARQTYPAPAVRVQESVFDDVPHRPVKRFDQAPTGKNRWLYWLSGLAVVVFGVALVVTVLMPSATITILPKSETISRQIELSASTEYADVDAQLLRIPAKTTDLVVAEENTFTTAGKKELGTKASGMVRIFNLSPTPLNLKKATTSLKIQDKEYLLASDAMSVPALTAKTATSPNAGFLAKIEASGFGESYNFPENTKLEITNQVFGNKPEVLYAKVETGLVGGSSRFISVVQQNDLDTAKEKLIMQALDKNSSQLTLEGYTLPEGAYKVETQEFTTDVPLDTEATSFKATLKAKLVGLAFKPEQLQTVIRARVETVLPEATTLQSMNKDKLTYKVSEPDFTAGSMKLAVFFESRLYHKLDLPQILKEAPGKSIDNFLADLKKQDTIESAKVDIFPSQRKKLPVLKQKIVLKIQES